MRPWILAAALAGVAGSLPAQLCLLPTAEPPQVFGGGTRPIPVVWQNPGDQLFTGEIQARMLQASSATVVPVCETRWKVLSVLPRQTVLESALLEFPSVKAETTFLIQWFEHTNQILGQTEVRVYPTNLLAELKPLAAGQPLGIFDPGNVLKPLLKAAQVGVTDLEASDWAGFRGRLAIIGPFASREQVAGNFAEQIKRLAGQGVGVVWIQPPATLREALRPSLYSVPVGTNVVVVVPAELLAGVAEQPLAQLRLVEYGRLALHPEPAMLPVFAAQP